MIRNHVEGIFNCKELYKDNLFKKILKFNEQTTRMQNHIKNKNGFYTKLTNEIFMQKYYTLTPQEFVQYNGGICFDFVTFQSDFFINNFPGINFKAFFMELFYSPEHVPTHGFMLFGYKDYCYWFESSWISEAGIHQFADINYALTYIFEKFAEYNNYNHWGYLKKTFITEYFPLQKKNIGKNYLDFLKNIKNIYE